MLVHGHAQEREERRADLARIRLRRVQRPRLPLRVYAARPWHRHDRPRLRVRVEPRRAVRRAGYRRTRSRGRRRGGRGRGGGAGRGVLEVLEDGLADEALPLLERGGGLGGADEERAGAEGGDDAELAVLVGDQPDPARGEHAEDGGAEAGLELRDGAVVEQHAADEGGGGGGASLERSFVRRRVCWRGFLRRVSLKEVYQERGDVRTRFSRKNELFRASEA